LTILILLTTVTLASSYSALPDDGDYTETCWSCFNVNFNTSFKNLFITWCKSFDNIKMHGTAVGKKIGTYFVKNSYLY
jgi:hypothetical protein